MWRQWRLSRDIAAWGPFRILSASTFLLLFSRYPVKYCRGILWPADDISCEQVAFRKKEREKRRWRRRPESGLFSLSRMSPSSPRTALRGRPKRSCEVHRPSSRHRSTALRYLKQPASGRGRIYIYIHTHTCVYVYTQSAVLFVTYEVAGFTWITHFAGEPVRSWITLEM